MTLGSLLQQLGLDCRCFFAGSPAEIAWTFFGNPPQLVVCGKSSGMTPLKCWSCWCFLVLEGNFHRALEEGIQRSSFDTPVSSETERSWLSLGQTLSSFSSPSKFEGRAQALAAHMRFCSCVCSWPKPELLSCLLEGFGFGGCLWRSENLFLAVLPRTLRIGRLYLPNLRQAAEIIQGKSLLLSHWGVADVENVRVAGIGQPPLAEVWQSGAFEENPPASGLPHPDESLQVCRMLSLTRGNSKTLPRGDCWRGRMSPSHFAASAMFPWVTSFGFVSLVGLVCSLGLVWLLLWQPLHLPVYGSTSWRHPPSSFHELSGLQPPLEKRCSPCTSWRGWEGGGGSGGKTLSGGLGSSWPTSSPDAFFVRGSWWGEGGPEEARLLPLEAWCFAHQRGRFTPLFFFFCFCLPVLPFPFTPVSFWGLGG